MRRSAVVVGAGLGGLATAIRLRHAGWDVTVLEKNNCVGGRCNVLREDGFTFDTGPTLLLMRDVLDNLFASVGHDLEDYLELVRIHPNYCVHFADGWSLEFSSHREKMARQLEDLEPGAADAFRRYIDDAGYKYRVSRDRFVERNFNHLYQFTTPANLYYLFSTNTLRKLDRHARRYFKDPRIVAAVTFQSMYLGLAPHHAPAVYSLLPYTELEQGIWFPRGGMYQIVESLRGLAETLGVCVQTRAEVERIRVRGRRVLAVELTDGRIVDADVVIANADLPYVYDALIPRQAQSAAHRTRMRHLNHGSSAFLMFLGLDREYPELNHHDVYLSADVAGNFDAIFRHGRLPDDPSFYTCAAGRTDRSLAPAGKEGLYVLVPVPSSSPATDWTSEIEAFKQKIYDRLTDVGLQKLKDHVVFERIYTPDDFVADYNVTRGSAFGLSHSFFQVGYMRPANKAAGLDNLYFVGASTVPGGGVPMVIMGSRLTAERVEEDWAGA